MFRKNITFLLVVLGLLFNIQAGFTHGVEHINHDHESHENHDHESHASSNDQESNASLKICDECLLIHSFAESSNLNHDLYFSFHNYTNFNYYYDVSKKITYAFVAYHSQAP